MKSWRFLALAIMVTLALGLRIDHQADTQTTTDSTHPANADESQQTETAQPTTQPAKADSSESTESNDEEEA